MVTPYQKRKARVGKYNASNIMFTDFSEGLYLLDTPRDITEQLGSLALIGGRNVMAEKGSLISQYGYTIRAKLPDEEVVIGISKDSLSATSFFIVTLLGNIYLYTASQGLKKFATQIDISQLNRDVILARRNNDLILYIENQCILFGNYYNDSDFVAINTNLTLSEYAMYLEARVPEEFKDSYWIDKKVSVKDDLTGKTYPYKVSAINTDIVRTEEGIETNLVLKLVWEDVDVEQPAFQGTVTLGEQALLPIDLIYHPEEESLPDINITPTLMEVCNNRLCVVDITGNIFYSQVGILTEEDGVTNAGFNEAYGAGYFGGFYNDSSECLAIEEYKTGVLITKKNGMYYLTIADTSSSQSVSAESQIGINITKVADIGQQYPTDHVIVAETVYAYDSNSASIVQACTQNMFGSIVAGKTLIDSEFLNAQNYGIPDTKRCLVFNKEAAVFVLYYGEDLKYGIVLNSTGNLYPREMDKSFIKFQGFNQSVYGVTEDNLIIQDYRKNTIIPNVSPIAEFEAIGLKDNRCICSSIIEITELNGVEYDLTTRNILTSYQHIKPYTNLGIDKNILPPMLYSDEQNVYQSFGLTLEEEELVKRGDITEEEIIKTKGLNKWASKKSNSTRIYAPMSGREGISLSIEFPENVAFCMAGIRLNDFSQGD